jgi:hypothetical protein
LIRIPLILLLAAACAAVARPAAAQETRVLRTPTYEVEVPDGFDEPETLETRGETLRDVRRIVAPKEGWIVIAMTAAMPLRPTLDSAGREAILDTIVAAFVGADKALGTRAPASTPHMVAMRVPIRGENGGPGGWLVVAMPRSGATHLVTLRVSGERGAPQRLADRLTASLRPGPDGATAAAPPADMLAWLAGTWNWERFPLPCDENPFTTRVSAGRDTLYLDYQRAIEPDKPRSSLAYLVTGSSPGTLGTALQGEQRRDSAGRPVAWDFVWVDDDSFCWRRSDWPSHECTPRVVRSRCEARPGGQVSATPRMPVVLPRPRTATRAVLAKPVPPRRPQR